MNFKRKRKSESSVKDVKKKMKENKVQDLDEIIVLIR